MTVLSLPRMALLLGLLSGSAFSASAALANPWRPSPAPQLGWVQAQRDWADESYRQTQRRLDQLEQCLGRARQRWDRDQCLHRDEQARERQWQRDQQRWQALMRRHSQIPYVTTPQPWRPLVGI